MITDTTELAYDIEQAIWQTRSMLIWGTDSVKIQGWEQYYTEWISRMLRKYDTTIGEYLAIEYWLSNETDEPIGIPWWLRRMNESLWEELTAELRPRRVELGDRICPYCGIETHTYERPIRWANGRAISYEIEYEIECDNCGCLFDHDREIIRDGDDIFC